MNYRINLITRVKILNALVRSRLSYGCQTWTLSSEQKNRINSFYCGLLRRMVRGGFKRKEDRMAFEKTNKDLLDICKTEEMSAFIARQQKCFLAHIIRREDNTLVKSLTFNTDTIHIFFRRHLLITNFRFVNPLMTNLFHSELINIMLADHI